MLMRISFLAVAVTCCSCLFATAANAQVIKTCVGVDVRSVEVVADSDFAQNRNKSIFLPAGPSPTVDILVPQEQKTARESTQESVAVVACGPVLGSMDSRKIETNFSCTANGVSLTSIIMRSANYAGAVQKNITWRPQLHVLLVVHQSVATFETIWKMRLSNGSDVTHAETPSYATQQYPIIVTRTVRSSGSQK